MRFGEPNTGGRSSVGGAPRGEGYVGSRDRTGRKHARNRCGFLRRSYMIGHPILDTARHRAQNGRARSVIARPGNPRPAIARRVPVAAVVVDGHRAAAAHSSGSHHR